MPYNIEVIPAIAQNKAVLENLMHLYLYDFTEYTGDDTDEQGRFIDEHLEYYWIEANRYPFQILVDGKPAGFVLVRDMQSPEDGDTVHSIAEFFIMKKYRRRHIGQQAAWHIFDRFPGSWHVAEIEENLPAQQFWRGVIAEYTDGAYQEVRQADWEGPIQLFTSPKNAG